MRRTAVIAMALCVTAAPGAGAAEVVTTTGGVAMVRIPAGAFTMGSARGAPDARPPHTVRVDAFWIDRTEVTQAQFDRLQISNPSHFEGADRPAEQVTWAQAAAFCNARSRAEGLESCYDADTGACDFSKKGYRLPTEAEWEYAARAGSAADDPSGGDPRRLGAVAWFAGNSMRRTHPVAQLKANAWGLHDMLGNVGEWCNDIYAPDAYAAGVTNNPRGPVSGRLHCVRGGAWNTAADGVRVFARSGENPGFTDACLHRDAIGFRCVRRSD